MSRDTYLNGRSCAGIKIIKEEEAGPEEKQEAGGKRKDDGRKVRPIYLKQQHVKPNSTFLS